MDKIEILVYLPFQCFEKHTKPIQYEYHLMTFSQLALTQLMWYELWESFYAFLYSHAFNQHSRMLSIRMKCFSKEEEATWPNLYTIYPHLWLSICSVNYEFLQREFCIKKWGLKEKDCRSFFSYKINKSLSMIIIR
jgi:hypothetical protein